MLRAWRTPLSVAPDNGHVEVVRALLGAKAAVDLADNIGCTPLHMASQNGHVEVDWALLGAKAAVDLADDIGATPLKLASIYNCTGTPRLWRWCANMARRCPNNVARA